MSNHDNNKFILLLRKGVYLYECMDDREKLFTLKIDFYSDLDMEDNTDADYVQSKEFEIKKDKRIS